MNGALLSVLSLIVVLGVLIFVHELGHFIAAKWAGIRVFRFALGIGTPIKRLTFKRGHTEYAVCWLPLGGYVKMASREELEGDLLEGGRTDVSDVPFAETFEAKPVWKRMVVILAGVAMNVVFAWVLFSGTFFATGRPLIPVTTIGRVTDSLVPPGARALTTLRPGDRIERIAGTPVRSWGQIQDLIQHAPSDTILVEVVDRDPLVLELHRDDIRGRAEAGYALEPFLLPVIGLVIPERPADRAGLERGDTILAVDGRPIQQWADMVREMDSRAGESVELVVGRGSGRDTVTVTPEEATVPVGETERRVGRIGIAVEGAETIYEPLSLREAVREGTRMTLVTSTLIVRVLRGMLTGRVSTREIGGPITIAQGAAETARRGWIEFLMFMGLISVNLAVVNLLPIPVLDGGQFLFLLGEAAFRKPLPLRLRQRLTAVGVLMVVLLMVLALSNDILRLVGI